MAQKDPSILLLSPDEGARATLRELLHPRVPVEALSVEAANQTAADHSFDILILDIESIDHLDSIVDACYGGAAAPIVLALAPRESGEALLERVEAGMLYRFVFKPFLAGQARLAVDAALRRYSDGPEPPLDIDVPPLPEPARDSRLVLLAGGASATAVLAAAGLFLRLYGGDPAADIDAPDTAAGASGRIARQQNVAAASPVAGPPDLAAVTRIERETPGSARLARDQEPAAPVFGSRDLADQTPPGNGSVSADTLLTQEIPAASMPAPKPANPSGETQPAGAGLGSEPVNPVLIPEQLIPVAIAGTEFNNTAMAAEHAPEAAAVTEATADTVADTTIAAPTVGDESMTDFDMAPLLADEARPISDALAASAADLSDMPVGAGAPLANARITAPLQTAAAGEPEPADIDDGFELLKSNPLPVDAGFAAPVDNGEQRARERIAMASGSARNNPDIGGSSVPVDLPAAPPPVTEAPPADVARAPDELVRTVYAAPEYPRYALQRDMQGWVTVSFWVGLDGIPADIAVVDSKPRKTFDRAAVRAVRDWRYEPPVENGQYVRQRTEVSIQFALD